MSAPARNAPCPCGSGKKWKKCHGAGARDVQVIAEDDTSFTVEADPQAVAGIASAIVESVESARQRFGIAPMDELTAAALVFAMLVKKHGAVEEDALMLVEKCIKGTFYNPHGFTPGNA